MASPFSSDILIDDGMFASVDELSRALGTSGYVPSREIATTAWLSDRLEISVVVVVG
jgi:hypothetical protein